MFSFPDIVYCSYGPRSPSINRHVRQNVRSWIMSKRRLIAALIAFVLTITVTGMWSAATIERDGAPDVNAIEDSGSSAGTMNENKGGNKVVKVLAAPFKAFGRLFGRNGDRK